MADVPNVSIINVRSVDLHPFEFEMCLAQRDRTIAVPDWNPSMYADHLGALETHDMGKSKR